MNRARLRLNSSFQSSPVYLNQKIIHWTFDLRNQSNRRCLRFCLSFCHSRKGICFPILDSHPSKLRLPGTPDSEAEDRIIERSTRPGKIHT